MFEFLIIRLFILFVILPELMNRESKKVDLYSALLIIIIITLFVHNMQVVQEPNCNMRTGPTRLNERLQWL